MVKEDQWKTAEVNGVVNTPFEGKISPQSLEENYKPYEVKVYQEILVEM